MLTQVEPSSNRAWNKFKYNRFGVACALLSATVLAAVALGPPVAERLLGHGPNDLLPHAVDVNLKPVGPMSWVKTEPPDGSNGRAHSPRKTLLVLGADGPLGRDELLRVLDGGRISLEVALGATLLATVLGTIAGLAAGLAGGALDVAISRLTELVMAFPLLLLLVMIGSTFSSQLGHITIRGALPPGVCSLIIVIGAFTWFYPARVVRAQVLTLKEQEFVEAAEMTGASPWRIARVHLLPHLVPTLAAYASVAIATNILLEASVTFLGVGIQLPQASWGGLLAATWGPVTNPLPWDPTRNTVWQTLWPTLAIMLAVFAFNHFGEAVRQAFDLDGES